MNKAAIATIAASIAIGGLSYRNGIPLVEYQTRCTKLQAMHELLITAVDPSMSFTDGEARRTPEQAKLNAQHGKGISNSLHLIGLARDKFLVINGKLTFDSSKYLQAGVLWEELGKNFGVPTRWGGRFSTVDAVHFSCEYQGVK